MSVCLYGCPSDQTNTKMSAIINAIDTQFGMKISGADQVDFKCWVPTASQTNTLVFETDL